MNELVGIRFGAQIATAARAHGLDPKLLAAVAAQETGGPGQSSGNNIIGDGGHGRGLFQIDDRSWAFARSVEAMDPARNADKAASILADNLGRYSGNVRMALSAYNAGSPSATGTTTTWADGRTLGYADSVLRHYADLGGSKNIAAQSLPDAHEQLVADAPETNASVNALSDLNATMLSSLTSPSPTTATQTTWRSWSSVDQGAGDPASDADRVLADLVGGSDSDDSAQ